MWLKNPERMSEPTWANFEELRNSKLRTARACACAWPGMVLLSCACVAPEAQTTAAQTATQTASVIVADSVSDFSGEQGERGWIYGYWNRSQDLDDRYDPSTDFRTFADFGDDPINGLSSRLEFTTGKMWMLQDGVYYTSIWASGGHPHAATALPDRAGEEHWAIRRWTSTIADTVEIAGHHGKTMPWGANWNGSVRVRIVVDDRVVLDAEADEQRELYALEVEVGVGSRIDFMLGPGRGGSMGVIDFTAMIRSRG